MTSDLPELRASHEDRNRVVETLRVAAGDGRLTAEELEERLEIALAARTLSELAVLTTDLPADAPSTPAAKDVVVIEQHGTKYEKTGRWVVPNRIEIRTQLCQVTLDFTDAVITSRTLRIDAEMVHGKLYLVGAPGIEFDTDGLTLTYSKTKFRTVGTGTDPRLRIELTGRLTHAKVIERKPRRRAG